MPAVFCAVLLGAAGEVVRPSGLEGGAGLFERLGVSLRVALSRPVVEADLPFPMFLVVRDAGARSYRADAGIAVIDVPAFMVDVGFAAPGERAHQSFRPAALRASLPASQALRP